MIRFTPEELRASIEDDLDKCSADLSDLERAIAELEHNIRPVPDDAGHAVSAPQGRAG